MGNDQIAEKIESTNRLDVSKADPNDPIVGRHKRRRDRGAPLYLVIFIEDYITHLSLHSSRAAAKTRYEALLREFVLKPGETLPPKTEWSKLCDDNGEVPHIYPLECDGDWVVSDGSGIGEILPGHED